MTREESISLIKSAQLMLVNPTTNEPVSDLYEALEMAISALEQNESAEKWYKLFVEKLDEQEPCEDAISREDVMDWLENATYDDVCEAIGTNLDFLPPVTPSRRKGHWRMDIDNSRGHDWRRFYCSECGSWQTYGYTRFCCDCGAPMEKEESEDK